MLKQNERQGQFQIVLVTKLTSLVFPIWLHHIDTWVSYVVALLNLYSVKMNFEQREVTTANFTFVRSLAKWLECSSMVHETCVQSQVASYQRLWKWYSILPCLTLSNISYASKVKWSNSVNGVAPSPTPLCSSSWNGSLLVALNYGR